MKIGPYEIHPIETGRFSLDGGAMFGVVPKPLWSKANPPDERNRIPLAARALLITGNGKKFWWTMVTVQSSTINRLISIVLT